MAVDDMFYGSECKSSEVAVGRKLERRLQGAQTEAMPASKGPEGWLVNQTKAIMYV